MQTSPINLQAKLATFSDHWSPKIIAEMNDYQFKLAKLEGDFVWHKHEETDEAFLVLQGRMSIDLPDGQVDLEAGEMYVVPRGIEHRPRAEHECHVLLIEPAGVVNTGDSGDDMTAEAEWI